MEENEMETLYVNLGFTEYNGQTKQLRKIAVSRLGADRVAEMTNEDIEDYFKNEGYIPMVVHFNDGSDGIETIYLVKKEFLDSGDDVIVLRR